MWMGRNQDGSIRSDGWESASSLRVVSSKHVSWAKATCSKRSPYDGDGPERSCVHPSVRSVPEEVLGRRDGASASSDAFVCRHPSIVDGVRLGCDEAALVAVRWPSNVRHVHGSARTSLVRPFESLNRTRCTSRTVRVDRRAGRRPFGFDPSEIRPGAIPSDTIGWDRVASAVVRHKQRPQPHNEGRGRGGAGRRQCRGTSDDGLDGRGCRDVFKRMDRYTFTHTHAEHKCDQPSHPGPERTEYLSLVRTQWPCKDVWRSASSWRSSPR